jgi:hypothetical protein
MGGTALEEVDASIGELDRAVAEGAKGPTLAPKMNPYTPSSIQLAQSYASRNAALEREHYFTSRNRLAVSDETNSRFRERKTG